VASAVAAITTARMPSMIAPSVSREPIVPVSEATPGKAAEQAAATAPETTPMAAARSCGHVGAAASSTTMPSAATASAPRE
jgi:hypothetical protein